jgi:hypothetical protein
MGKKTQKIRVCFYASKGLRLQVLSESGPHLALPHVGYYFGKICDLGLYPTCNIIRSEGIQQQRNISCIEVSKCYNCCWNIGPYKCEKKQRHTIIKT